MSKKNTEREKIVQKTLEIAAFDKVLERRERIFNSFKL